MGSGPGQAESATALFSTFEADPKAPVDHVPMATDRWDSKKPQNLSQHHDGLCVFGMMTFVNTFSEFVKLQISFLAPRLRLYITSEIESSVYWVICNLQSIGLPDTSSPRESQPVSRMWIRLWFFGEFIGNLKESQSPPARFQLPNVMKCLHAQVDRSTMSGTCQEPQRGRCYVQKVTS